MLIVLERWGHCAAANVEVQTRVKQELSKSPQRPRPGRLRHSHALHRLVSSRRAPVAQHGRDNHYVQASLSAFSKSPHERYS
jgi:hypothetical protein